MRAAISDVIIFCAGYLLISSNEELVRSWCGAEEEGKQEGSALMAAKGIFATI